MSVADRFLAVSLWLALALLSLAFVLLVVRIAIGPTLPDRVLGLDAITGVGVGFLAVFGLANGVTMVVDIAVALGLVGFLATIAFARYVEKRGRRGEEPAGPAPGPEPRP